MSASVERGILTWLYLEGRGSLFICVLFHNAVNAGGYYFFIGIPGSSLFPLCVLTGTLGIVAATLLPQLQSKPWSDTPLRARAIS